MKLTLFELGWLVGLLEGEGHFRFSQRSQRVTLNTTDEDVMYKACGLFERITGKNHNPIETDKSKYNANAKPIFTIVLYSENARIVMREIVDHMGYRRRKRIWQALNGHEAPYRINRKAKLYMPTMESVNILRRV